MKGLNPEGEGGLHVRPLIVDEQGRLRLGIGDISDRYGRKQVIFPAACLISLNLFWISRVQSFGMFLVNGFIAGLGQGLIFPALSTYVIDRVGRENKGFALSLYLSLFDVGMGLGAPFFGWVSDIAGFRTMYVVSGALLLLSTIIFTWKAPQPNLAKNMVKS